MDVKVTIEVVLPDGRKLEHSLSVCVSTGSDDHHTPYWLITVADKTASDMISIVENALKSPEIA